MADDYYDEKKEDNDEEEKEKKKKKKKRDDEWEPILKSDDYLGLENFNSDDSDDD